MLQSPNLIKSGYVNVDPKNSSINKNQLTGWFPVLKKPIESILHRTSAFELIGNEVKSYAYVTATEEKSIKKEGYTYEHGHLTNEESVFYEKAIVHKDLSYDEMIDLCQIYYNNDTYIRKAVYANIDEYELVYGDCGEFSAVVNSARNSVAISRADSSILATTGQNTHSINYGNNSVTVVTEKQTAITTHGEGNLAAAIEPYANIIANGDSSIAIAYGTNSRVTVNGKNSVAISINGAIARGCLGSTLIFTSDKIHKKFIVDDFEIKSNVLYWYDSTTDKLVPATID